MTPVEAPAGTGPRPWAEPPAGYLDAVGGQPLLPAARQAWLAASDQAWSDPARLHHAGRRAGLVLDAARSSVATGLGVTRDEVFWTTSGPTAVAVGLQGLVGRARSSGRSTRVVASSVESLAVLNPLGALGVEVDQVRVDGTGRIDLVDLDRALALPCAVVAVQAASPEVGTRQPLDAVHARTRAAGAPLLVHAVQVIGRGPVPADWDLLATSTRDWAGPAGAGVLAVRRDLHWAPDESPDRGWVGGFPDIPAAAAAATALEQVMPVAGQEAGRAFALTARIRQVLADSTLGIAVTGDPAERLPHIVTFTCSGVTGEAVVDALSRRGISVASGSACTSDTRMPSQVLAAMGVAADASIRVSLPLGCPEATVDHFLTALPEALADARANLG
jgi:cysteine desulfurase